MKKQSIIIAIFIILSLRTSVALEISTEDVKSLLNKISNLESELVKLKEQVVSFDLNSKENVLSVNQNTIKNDKKDYDLALGVLKDQKFQEAELRFADFIQKYPDSDLQSNAYFWYGESFYRRGLFDKAAVNYLKGYKQFPKAVKAADSLLKLALSLGAINKQEEACKILTKLETEFPQRAISSIKRAKDASIKFGCGS